MAMKLLPKSDVLAARADEQRRKADEGARIARRVDAVRETLLTEEAKLEEFRRRKVAEIDADIASRRSEREGLKAEVSRLTRERKALLEPLDRERAEVADAKEKARADASEARDRLAEAHREQRSAREAVKKSSDALARALAKEGARREAMLAADADAEAARGHLEMAARVEAGVREMAEKLRAELASRDAECAARERGVTMRETSLQSAEAELAKGWRLLGDREAKLGRSITRLSKQK